MVKTCAMLKDELRKVGRKVGGTKGDLENRLKSVLHTNDRGWVKRGGAECTKIRYLDSGAHRHVYLQSYTKGPRKGQLCVKKVFKTGSVYESRFFEHDIKVTQEAAKLIGAFNKLMGGRRIYLNEPEVWHSSEPDRKGKRAQYLVEPYLKGDYVKFNSNTGYVESSAKMQALSHHSYEASGGSMLLCDLQGVERDDIFILTDPVICSADHQFGATDLGPKGIDNFFAFHKCGKYCRGDWRRPRQPQVHFPAVRGTTFSSAGTMAGKQFLLHKLLASL
mmetsp:Transcript_66501/g.107109  ORF Transcript_66501/g.107109 Transcript_66501/m.107109 type:complete len:277 (-) Transcript_66501:117-947(-)